MRSDQECPLAIPGKIPCQGPFDRCAIASIAANGYRRARFARSTHSRASIRPTRDPGFWPGGPTHSSIGGATPSSVTSAPPEWIQVAVAIPGCWPIFSRPPCIRSPAAPLRRPSTRSTAPKPFLRWRRSWTGGPATVTPLHASLDSASLSRADIRPARLALATARARATLHGDRRATVQPSQAFAETPEDFTTRLLPNFGLERLLTVRRLPSASASQPRSSTRSARAASSRIAGSSTRFACVPATSPHLQSRRLKGARFRNRRSESATRRHCWRAATSRRLSTERRSNEQMPPRRRRSWSRLLPNA